MSLKRTVHELNMGQLENVPEVLDDLERLLMEEQAKEET